MMKWVFGLTMMVLVSGCSILQGAYDELAEDERMTLPTEAERVACLRDAADAERARRQSE